MELVCWVWLLSQLAQCLGLLVPVGVQRGGLIMGVSWSSITLQRNDFALEPTFLDPCTAHHNKPTILSFLPTHHYQHLPSNLNSHNFFPLTHATPYTLKPKNKFTGCPENPRVYALMMSLTRTRWFPSLDCTDQATRFALVSLTDTCCLWFCWPALEESFQCLAGRESCMW